MRVPSCHQPLFQRAIRGQRVVKVLCRFVLPMADAITLWWFQWTAPAGEDFTAWPPRSVGVGACKGLFAPVPS